MERRSVVDGPRVRRTRGLRLLAGAAAASVACLLALAGPAFAGLKQEFSVFKTCPYEKYPEIQCIYSTTTAGEFHLGSKTVPVAPKVVVLKGGLLSGDEELIPPTDGEEISKTPLTLPGGLTGLGLLGGPEEVTATAEVVGPIHVNVAKESSGEGTAVSMPLRVKLDNTLLGAECLVGSASEPVALNLTTGTTNPPGPNTPIKGNPGKLVIGGAGKIGEVAGSSLVDNAFSAPGATGCNGAAAVVNADSGLPAAAGTNTAILDGAFKAAGGNVVKAVLALPALGRCVKAESEKVGRELVYKGLYVNSGCTYEIPQRVGKYEWEEGTGPGKKFTLEGKTTALETPARTKITCLEAHGSGEYTGTKTASIGSLALTGCSVSAAKEACQSAGAAAGELKTAPLSGELGFVKDEPITGGLVVSLGYALKGSSSTIIEGTCGPSKIGVKINGSLIDPISSIDKVITTYGLKTAQKSGAQAVESFEEEPKQTLSMLYGAVPSEPAGLASSLKVTDEEKLEFKAVEE